MDEHTELCDSLNDGPCTCKQTPCNIAGADAWTPSNGAQIAPAFHGPTEGSEGSVDGFRVSCRVYSRNGEHYV